MRPPLKRDIHQVLRLGPLTPDEAQQISIIMRRIGVMMQEMSNPQAEQFQGRHQWELQEMEKHLTEIKARLEGRRK